MHVGKTTYKNKKIIFSKYQCIALHRTRPFQQHFVVFQTFQANHRADFLALRSTWNFRASFHSLWWQPEVYIIQSFHFRRQKLDWIWRKSATLQSKNLNMTLNTCSEVRSLHYKGGYNCIFHFKYLLTSKSSIVWLYRGWFWSKLLSSVMLLLLVVKICLK